MSTVRVLLRQGEITFRFLELRARPDGSLVILIDREPSAIGPNSEGIDPQKVLANAKFTIHTTGQVNYYPHKKERRSTFNLGEPLTDLSRPHLVGIYSIPSLSRLDRISEPGTLDGTICIPIEATDRITFYFHIVPNAERYEGAIQVEYELYSLVVTSGPHPEMALNLPQHFVVAGRQHETPVASPALRPNEAELRFHQKVHDGQPPVFRNRDGSYTWLAAVVMRVPPKLNVAFDRPDLSIEQLPFEYGFASHKVRFYIRDGGGRNKRDDLRRHIVSIALDARL